MPACIDKHDSQKFKETLLKRRESLTGAQTNEQINCQAEQHD